MRRILLLIVAACLAFTAGRGCRKDTGGRLSFAVGGAPAELDYWQQLIAEFERDSGIKVELLRQPTDSDLRRQNLVTALKAKNADPDIMLLDVAWIAQFAASGWLEPLDTAAQQGDFELDAFFQTVIEAADRYNGTLIALPVYVDGGLLYYRRDLLEANGIAHPPETWEQLIEQARRVQERQRPDNPAFYGFVWQGAQYEGLICNWLEFAGSNGGRILTNEGVVVDSHANQVATALMHDLIHKHQLSPPNTYTEMKEEQVRLHFQQGNALFERNWPYAWSLHQAGDSPVRGRVGIAALPHFPGGQSCSTLGGWHVGLSKQADRKPDAIKLMRFILSRQTQKKLVLKLGWNPGRKDVYNDPEVVEKMPHFRTLRHVFDHLQSRPNVPYYTLVSKVLQRYVNAALSGELAPGEALSRAQQEVERTVRRYESR